MRRATLDRRMQHARQAGIDAVVRGTRGHREAVDRVDGLADVPIGVLRFEGGLFGDGHVRCQRHEFAIAEAAAARFVVHRMHARHALAGRHAPCGGSGSDQHFARRGTCAAQQVELLANAGRAVGILVAVFLVAQCLFQADQVPVGVELVGDDLRQAGADALAHLRPMAHDLHDAVRTDIHVDVRRQYLVGVIPADRGQCRPIAGAAASAKMRPPPACPVRCRNSRRLMRRQPFMTGLPPRGGSPPGYACTCRSGTGFRSSRCRCPHHLASGCGRAMPPHS